jgi:hypothetical protein
MYIHTYHTRFITEEVAEVSQIFLRDTHVLPKLVSYEEQPISGVSAINPLVALRLRRKERVAILLFCPGHHTR